MTILVVHCIGGSVISNETEYAKRKTRGISPMMEYSLGIIIHGALCLISENQRHGASDEVLRQFPCPCDDCSDDLLDYVHSFLPYSLIPSLRVLRLSSSVLPEALDALIENLPEPDRQRLLPYRLRSGNSACALIALPGSLRWFP